MSPPTAAPVVIDTESGLEIETEESTQDLLIIDTNPTTFAIETMEYF